MSAKDGGSAFPRDELNQNDPRGDGTFGLWMQHPGMSLRDYFATAALPELLRNAFSQKDHPDQIIAISFQALAETSYRLADAMLKARSA